MKKLTLVLSLSLFTHSLSHCFSASTDLLLPSQKEICSSKAQLYKKIFIQQKVREITFPSVPEERKKDFLEKKVTNDIQRLGGSFIACHSRKKNILALSIITPASIGHTRLSSILQETAIIRETEHYLDEMTEQNIHTERASVFPYFYVQPVIFSSFAGKSKKEHAKILRTMIEKYAQDNALSSSYFYIQVYNKKLAREAQKIGFKMASGKDQNLFDFFPNFQNPDLFPTLSYSIK